MYLIYGLPGEKRFVLLVGVLLAVFAAKGMQACCGSGRSKGKRAVWPAVHSSC